MLNLSDKNLKILTIEGQIPFPTKINGIKIKKELVKPANTILKILDLIQFSTCKQIEALEKKEDTPSKKILFLTKFQKDSSQMITDLGTLIMAELKTPQGFEKVLSEWIVAATVIIKQKIVLPLKFETTNLTKIETRLVDIQKKLNVLKTAEKKLQFEKHQLEKSILLEKETSEIVSHFLVETDPIKLEINLDNEVKLGLIKELDSALLTVPYLLAAFKLKKKFDIFENLENIKK